MAGLILRQRVLLAKVETTSGTAESLSGTDGVFNVFTEGDSPIITPNIPMTERPGQSSFDRLPGIAGARAANIAFSMYLVGLGSSGSPAWATTFLQACGGSDSSGTWTFPTGSSSAKTITVAEYIDGRVHSAAGCVLNATFNYKPGEIVKVDFNGIGIYQTDADTALPTPTYPTVKPPRWANSSGLTVGAYSPLVSSLTISLGNVLKLREDANNVTGYKAGIITDRVPTWSMDPELEVVATKDWMAEFLASTQASLAAVVGTATNNIITTTLPKAQVTSAPTPGSRDGVAVHSLSGIGGRSASAGDDAIGIVFS